MPIRHHSTSFAGLALLLVPVLAACHGGDDDGQDEMGETTDGETTAGETTAGETAGETTEGETTEGETTAGETTAGETTEGETGDTGDPDLTEGLCMDACALIGQCEPEDPDCVEACIDAHEFSSDCLGSMQALTICIAGLNCEQYDQYVEGEPEPYPCQAEEEQLWACEDM